MKQTLIKIAAIICAVVGILLFGVFEFRGMNDMAWWFLLMAMMSSFVAISVAENPQMVMCVAAVLMVIGIILVWVFAFKGMDVAMAHSLIAAGFSALITIWAYFVEKRREAYL